MRAKICTGVALWSDTRIRFRMKEKLNNTIHTTLWQKLTLSKVVSGKGDSRMSQVSQLPLFTNVLTMSLRILLLYAGLAPSSLFHVTKILIYVNANYHKLRYQRTSYSSESQGPNSI